MVDPFQVFTPLQVEALSRLIGQLASAQTGQVDPRGVVGATVLTYNASTRRATVKVDGSTGSSDAFNWINNLYVPGVGDRVFVWFEPPAGLLLVGVIRVAAVPTLMGCTVAAPAFPVPNNTVVHALAGLSPTTDPTGIYDPTTGEFTVPAGGDGLWSGGARFYDNLGSGITRLFAEWVDNDGNTYRTPSGFLGYDPMVPAIFVDGIFTAPLPTQNLAAGQTFAINMFQTNLGTVTVDFDLRIDFWQVRPGRAA